MKIKSVQDLWREFKVRNYGKDIDKISHVQMRESELVFHSAAAAMLINLKDEVSKLPDAEGAKVLQGYLDEIGAFFEKAQVEYNRMPDKYKYKKQGLSVLAKPHLTE